VCSSDLNSSGPPVSGNTTTTNDGATALESFNVPTPPYVRLLIRTNPAIAGVLFAITFIGICGAQPQQHTNMDPVVTTLCDVISHSETWNGKRVRFRASVISDGIDHTALADPKCKDRVIPRISEEARDRPDVARFWRSLFIDKPRGTAFKEVSATFTGTFVLDRKVRALQVEEVRDLTVTPKKGMP
jgi:hypothetical protein